MKVSCLEKGAMKFGITVPVTQRISDGVLVTRDMKGAKLEIKTGSVKPKFPHTQLNKRDT